MSSSPRTRLSIALAAFALATLSLPATAQSWMPSGPLDTPNFLEAWDDDDAAPAVDSKTADADAPVRLQNHRNDPEAPAQAVTVVRTSVTGDGGRPRQSARLPSIINQYEQNPRCYVAGQYVPAPPLCPN
ncbi:MAG: hypothetical protein ACREJT_07985 [Myxococcota bacterium]